MDTLKKFAYLFFALALVFFALAITIAFTGCIQNNNSRPNSANLQSNIVYCKDGHTGLCYAVINSQSTYGYLITSIACVPCDSLKKLAIKSQVFDASNKVFVWTVYDSRKENQ